MLHRKVAGLALVVSAAFLIAAPAGAVVKGTRTTALSHSTVRLVGDGNCSGVVIARRAVVTAGHCAAGMSVLAGGRIYRVAHISRSAKLDDGTSVRVSGDAAILLLSSPLPDAVEAIPVGEGDGDTYVIAGYGTTNERWRGAGPLHQAELVKAGDFALVDPSRKGLIGASGCYGDSGGPVIRGGQLVGVITRAAHPSPRIACGDLTRWAPISTVAETDLPAEPEIVPALKRTAPARVHTSPRLSPSSKVGR